MMRRIRQKLVIPKALEEKGVIRLCGENVAYTLTRSARRRRTISYVIDDDGVLRITVPVRTRFAFVEEMLHRRAPGILFRLAEHRKLRANAVQDFTDGEEVLYLGHRYRLRVTQYVAAPQGCVLRPHFIDVNIADAAISEKALREEVRLEILLWLKRRARVKFKKRMDLWAKRLGVTYTKLLVTDPARQWGSCSADNVIRLNWRLLMAPLELLDYVVTHELAHIRHKNHSPRFWNFLARAMPDYGPRRKRLRQMGSGLVL
jgi:predicted metal-dependent hydrolase